MAVYLHSGYDSPPETGHRTYARAGLEEDAISDADAAFLCEVSEEIDILGPSKYSDHRHEFILRRSVVLARETEVEIHETIHDKDPAREVVAYINSTKNNSPETNKDYRSAFRNLARIATDGDEFPEAVA